MKSRGLSSWALLVALLSACGVAGEDGLDPAGTLADSNYPAKRAFLDRWGLLDFVNDAQHTTLYRLDADCGLRSDAARNIVAHRDGSDALVATADDNPFDTLDELEGVSMVGPHAIELLYACASADGYLFVDEPGLTAFLNDAATGFDELDDTCAIRSDSATALLLHRNGEDGVYGTEDDDLFESVEEIDDVYMVGLWTLSQLYVCAFQHGFVLPDHLGQGTQVEIITDVDGLPEQLRTVVDGQLLALANARADHRVADPMHFAEAEITRAGTVAARYEVRFEQGEGELARSIIFLLDGELQLLGTSVRA